MQRLRTIMLVLIDKLGIGMAIFFDTLEYVKGAEAIGMQKEHAEYQAKQLANLVDNNLATKTDILVLKKDIENIRTFVLSCHINLKNEMIIKLGGLMIVGMGILGFILKN
jgi:hypothetical protein